MKTTSKELNKVWGELCDIFLNFKRYDNKMKARLEKLGFECSYKKGKHPKLYIVVNGKKHCIVLSTTPSDPNTGRQILREIRRIYELQAN